MKKVPGVVDASVDYESKTLTVECTEAVTADVVTTAVAETEGGDYTATPVEN